MDFWVLLGAPSLVADPWAAMPRPWRWRYRMRHVPAVPGHALALAATALGVPAAALAAARWPERARGAQLWIATPYRAEVRAYPQARAHAMPLALASSERAQLSRILTPLLEPLGLALVDAGGALLVVAERIWDVHPPDFGHLRTQGIPNRPPSGRDAKDWLRLHAEMEMALRKEGLADGLWLWGGAPLPCDAPRIRACTNDPELAAMADARDARAVFVDLAASSSLWPPRRPPRHILIAGASEALELSRRAFAWPLLRAGSGPPRWPALLRARLIG